MTRSIYVFTIAALLTVAGPARAQQTDAASAQRPTLTVMELATDRTGWVPPPRLGETLAELLTDRLLASGRFRIVDGEALQSTEGEHRHLSLGEMSEQARKAGVDYVLVGAVVRFSNEKQQHTGGGFLPIPFIGGLFHKSKVESTIGLALRIVDTRTGEIVATATSEGAASDSHVTGGGLVVVGKAPLPIGGAAGSSATGIQDRLLASAVRDAVDRAAQQLVQASGRMQQ